MTALKELSQRHATKTMITRGRGRRRFFNLLNENICEGYFIGDELRNFKGLQPFIEFFDGHGL